MAGPVAGKERLDHRAEILVILQCDLVDGPAVGRSRQITGRFALFQDGERVHAEGAQPFLEEDGSAVDARRLAQVQLLCQCQRFRRLRQRAEGERSIVHTVQRMADICLIHRPLQLEAAGGVAKIFIPLALAAEHGQIARFPQFLVPIGHEPLHEALAAGARMYGNAADEPGAQLMAAHGERFRQAGNGGPEPSHPVHGHAVKLRGILARAVHARNHLFKIMRAVIVAEHVVHKIDARVVLLRMCLAECDFHGLSFLSV